MSLWGKAIDSYEQDVHPLAGMPQPEKNGQWHIAVAHGYYVSAKPALFPSYNITQEEIVTPGWDYVALGHVITFKCVCNDPVKAYYCGSPSVFDTVAVVDLKDETGAQVTRCSLEHE